MKAIPFLCAVGMVCLAATISFAIYGMYLAVFVMFFVTMFFWACAWEDYKTGKA